MKRTFALPPRYAVAASALLMLSFVLIAGCSGSEGSEGSEKVAGKFELDDVEYAVLKKANPNPKNFAKAVRKLQIEEVKAAGAVVKTVPSGRRSNRPR